MRLATAVPATLAVLAEQAFGQAHSGGIVTTQERIIRNAPITTLDRRTTQAFAVVMANRRFVAGARPPAMPAFFHAVLHCGCSRACRVHDYHPDPHLAHAHARAPSAPSADFGGLRGALGHACRAA